MNKLTKLAATVAISGVLMTVLATPAMAQTVSQNQELNQTVKVNCNTTTSGAYGQNTQTDCYAEGTQNGKQTQSVDFTKTHVQLRNGKWVQRHTVANTSVDTMTISGLIATAAATAGAGFLTIKKRK